MQSGEHLCTRPRSCTCLLIALALRQCMTVRYCGRGSSSDGASQRDVKLIIGGISPSEATLEETQAVLSEADLARSRRGQSLFVIPVWRRSADASAATSSPCLDKVMACNR